MYSRRVNQAVIQICQMQSFSHENPIIKSKTSPFAITFHYQEIKINKWKFIGIGPSTRYGFISETLLLKFYASNALTGIRNKFSPPR